MNVTGITGNRKSHPAPKQPQGQPKAKLTLVRLSDYVPPPPAAAHSPPKAPKRKRIEISPSATPPLKQAFVSAKENVPMACPENRSIALLEPKPNLEFIPFLEPSQLALSQEDEMETRQEEPFRMSPTTPEILEALAYKVGTQPYCNGTYVGELLELVPHGKGTWHSRGNTYEGDWSNGQFHGHGSYHYANGDFYQGEWHSGKRQGKGTMIFSNDDSYEGDWLNGCMHGHGVGKYGQSGSFYEGEWQENKRHGHGTFHFKGGLTFEGEYRNNLKQGVFKIVTPSGSACELTFEDGKPLSGSARLIKISSEYLEGKKSQLAQLALDKWIKKR